MRQLTFCFAGALMLIAQHALAQSDSTKPIPVTPGNFVRAETDGYFATAIKVAGGIGKLHHYHELMPIDHQTVVRANRDTVYSAGVFDLDAGPVTITLPDAGKRFMSVMLVNEDHYVFDVWYGAGQHTITKDEAGTRYILVGVRTFVDPSDPKDMSTVRVLQDAIKVKQASPGTFEVPLWDAQSQKKVRDALEALGSTAPSFKGAFGKKGEVDPVMHLVGTATGWGGNPERDATYLNVTPPRNDGKTSYHLVVKDVPVDAFWSISVYDAKGYFKKNSLDAYTINNVTAHKAADGSVPIQFGDCDTKTPNCLPITPGWNYTVRLYRPRAEILDGSWTFPEPRP